MVDAWLPLQLYLKKFDAELLFTDTDSLTYEIKLEDIYEDFYKDKHLFDLSKYSKDSKFFILSMKKLFSKWKMRTNENQSVNLLE